MLLSCSPATIGGFACDLPFECCACNDPHERITKTPQKGFCDVPRAVRKRISAFLVKSKDDRIVLVCRMPATRETYLVSAEIEAYDKQTDNYGVRFLLLTRNNQQLRVVYHSKGMMDSWYLYPIFFIGRDRILAFAETGAEEFWELQAFEYKTGSLRNVGAIDIGRLRSDEGQSCWVNPLEDASVEAANGSYRLYLHGELYLHPDAYDQRKISKPGSTTTLVYDGRNFKVVNAVKTKGK